MCSAISVSLTLLMVVSGSAVFAQDTEIPVDAKGLPMWSIAEWNDFPVRIELADKAELDALLKRVPLASFEREQLTIQYDTPKSFHLIFEPRITEAEAAALTAAGYEYERIADLDRQGREEAERIWAEQAAKGGDALLKGDRGFYPTHAQIGAVFAELASENPDIARTFTWGQSIQGRDLWGIVISDDVQNTEAEPEVRLSSTMHGDEPPGMVMLFNFAQYLVNNYGQPGYDDVTNLVDNYEIHIMALHNPDGYVLDRRGNANNVDLNRNFPEPAGSQVTEPENILFMNHANSQHFVVSGNGHSGALVVNYPWDYTYTLSADDAALQLLSLEYSTYNSPMYNGSFPQGITNGADWYVALGTLQDWATYVTDCIDVTLELHNIKWPPASYLDGLWDENRESLMHYVKAARYGINGVVTGADTGLPLDATVTVSGKPIDVHTDPAHGDYYKLLHSGTFDLTYAAEGYITQTVYGITTSWGTPTVQDVVLQPVAHGDVSGVVTNSDGAGLNAQVNIYQYPTDVYVTTVNATAATGGAYSAHLVYGDYRLEAVASDYVTQSQTVTIGAEPVVANFSLNVAAEVVLFFSDFEDGIGDWVGEWGLTDPAEGYNSDNSLNDSPGGEYDSYDNNPMAMINGVDLGTAMSGELTFWAKWEIEPVWDGCFLEISVDGGAEWTPVATPFTTSASGQGGQTPSGAPVFQGNRANWVLNTVNLLPWLGQNDVRFRFRLASDVSEEQSGFFFDDFQILAVQEGGGVAPVPGIEVLSAAVMAWPNPFNPQTTVQFINPRAGQVQVGIYNLQGRLVRQLVSESLPAGEHDVLWDGRADDGARAASGVYFARMIAGEELATTKVMMVK